MSAEDFLPLEPAIVSWRDGEPCATAFNDHYFSRDNGLQESRHVFIDGNALKQRFSALPAGQTLVVGETGFGTGLNFLACMACFLEHADRRCRLHFISVEKHPLRREDLEQALQRWPELTALSQSLLDSYPPLAPGFHRRSFANGRIQLTLAFGDVTAMLGQLRAQVDAWFLDGFAPARNQAMWSEQVFRLLAQHSAPGATLATFTSAGFVRRGLGTAGFAMQRQPGFGRKREMLCGHLTGDDQPVRHPVPQHIAVVGAGLAGCTTAFALARRGARVTLFDRSGVAGQASGNLAGVVYTTPSAHFTAQNRFYQASYLHALTWFRQLQFPRHRDDGALTGVIQYGKDARQRERARQALDSGYWPRDECQQHGTNAICLPHGGYISPVDWCRFLLSQTDISVHEQAITGVEHTNAGWRLQTGAAPTGPFDQVVLATAATTAELVELPWLKLKSIRGQVSQVAATEASARWPQAICHAGYLTPAIRGMHCVGATFDLHRDDPAADDDDDRANLAQLREWLPEQWRELGADQAKVVTRRVGFRCQSTDFLPIVGALGGIDPEHAGLWLNIAHGSRGITGTPLCAELLASDMFGEPLPMDGEMRDALSPQRFIRRQQQPRRRRGGSSG